MQKQEEEIFRTNIEAEIKKDKSGEFRAKLKSELAAAAELAEQQLKSGLGPDEYQRMEKVSTGLRAAEAILDGLWQAYHPQHT